jgi:hypothetical protein
MTRVAGRRFVGMFFAFLMVGLLPGAAWAQDTTLSGTVSDTTDAVLPGVNVTAMHVESGNTFSAITDVRGTYVINGMRAGVYKVTVELQGFASQVRDGLELQVGQHPVLNFKLAVTAVAETVTVSGAAPLIDTTQSKLSGNIDPRQIRELPLNGRNWMDLTLLSPGSRVNSVSGTALTGPTNNQISSSGSPFGNTGAFQLNVDGQQVTNQLACTSWGQAKFSNDAIQEFEMITSRFDASQGRSTGVQVNAVTKSGTNRFGGSGAAYFRSDSFNSADFITHTVLPYSDQQGSITFGGPIKRDKMHFFGYWDGERNPNSYTFTSSYPSFNNVPGFTNVLSTDNKWGGRTDLQINPNMHLMGRVNGFYDDIPGASNTGGALLHPSRSTTSTRKNYGGLATLTNVLGPRAFNEVRAGYTTNISGDFTTAGPSPQVSITGGYTIGNLSFQPLYLTFRAPSVRDDFTYRVGEHQVKLGGEFLYYYNSIYWPSNKYGVLNATNGQPPANLESLFPVWNDPTSWNLNGLAKQTISWTQSVSNNDYYIFDPMHVFAFWLQDDWRAGSKLTLNLGIRWDAQLGGLGESLDFPPFHTPRGHELHDFGPRLGFAYQAKPSTVFRGGWGMYYQGQSDQPSQHALLDPHTVSLTVFNDGRPDFPLNPFNGPIPPYDQAVNAAGTRSTSGILLSQYAKVPLTYQFSVGVEQQFLKDMSFKVDLVGTNDLYGRNTRNINLTFNPATGANYPFNDPAHRAYPAWSIVNMEFNDLSNRYRGVEMGFVKRMDHNWQASVSYTLQYLYQQEVVPLNDGCQYPAVAAGVCNVPITLAPDLPQGAWYLTGAQRNRVVLNGIWLAPLGLQLSGIYLYGDNGVSTTTPGVDVRQANTTAGRLNTDGTLIPRNNFQNDPTSKFDARIQRGFKLTSTMRLDLMAEAFNLFNHATFAYVTNQASKSFGQVSTANLPRTIQLGFRLTY